MGIGAILLALGIYLFIGIRSLNSNIPLMEKWYKKEMKGATLEERRAGNWEVAKKCVLIVLLWPWMNDLEEMMST